MKKTVHAKAEDLFKLKYELRKKARELLGEGGLKVKAFDDEARTKKGVFQEGCCSEGE